MLACDVRRYFVALGVLQATHRGAQLRAGAAMYALMVEELFDPANWLVIKAKARARIARHAIASGAASARVQDSGFPVLETPAVENAAQEHDWEPFFQRFGDMLPQVALNATMAAFGQLMNDLHGYNKTNDSLPRAELTERVRTQVQDLAVGMVEPLFGAKSSSKLHEHLCHAADEMRLRGDFTMADTTPNEQKHKQEKAAYKRTNRQAATAGLQHLTVVQARIILQEEDDKVVADSPENEEAEEIAPTAAELASEGSADSDAASGDMDGDLPVAGVVPKALRERGVRVSVQALAERPGLGKLASLFDTPSYAEVSVISTCRFTAVHEWHALPCTELLRSSIIYYGTAWYDCVRYRSDAGDQVHMGQVRVIVAGGTDGCMEPCAVVQVMENAPPLSSSPLAAAGYQRLRWAFDNEAAVWPSLVRVPLSDMLRIVHIVPDVQLLAPSGLMMPHSVQACTERMGLRAAYFLNNILSKSTTLL